METLQPAGWPRPRGYSNGLAARGKQIFISGMIGWEPDGVFRAKDFAGQVRQALANIVEVLAEAGAGPEHIVRMTWYVLDKRVYVASYEDIGKAYREIIGRHFPAMTAVQVAGLVEDEAQVEIEVTAVIPD
ncbi:RidA family protein [Pigmentiphaga sp.]|uniref:RidA family protein n=1 Tax=Pigmentiphaga sp. TaxID=1977564 RepID=UPI0012C91628|nr:RidA family protein [Pigmentiphaga sp.]MPS29435.1 RidA family protein [Alcaligenaceae bacterium SAGV5]MPS55421.1 RidA family protein [Alcaligenaceae bacterium SAGV3]MPT60112.1 RidA family protein [Alcaligenaceae bacterium]